MIQHCPQPAPPRACRGVEGRYSIVVVLLTVLGLLSTGMDVSAQPGMAQAGKSLALIGSLDDLVRLRNTETKRVSSFDRTGGNNDRITINPGETVTLAEIEGAGCIKHIWFTVSHPDKLYRRNLVLRMYWDGEENPSVESPLGDFFGQGWGEEYLFNSLPLAAAPGGGRALNCFFPMPFAKGAKITVENQSEEKCPAFYYYIDYEKQRSLGRDVLRFHAWWNHELTTPSSKDENEWELFREPDKNTSGEENYLILDAEGEGHYVGVNYFVHSPTPMWPGEGDDLFLIDGEPWPGSLHGTGTEDYFNSSWCPKEIFMHPFFGYARVNSNIGWLGRTHCYRFHLQEPVTFEKSLRVSIEHGHANCLTLDLATVAYWYQKEPHKPFPPLEPPEKRKPMPEIGVVDIHRWREAWRQSMGGGVLWGNEEEEKPTAGEPERPKPANTWYKLLGDDTPVTALFYSQRKDRLLASTQNRGLLYFDYGSYDKAPVLAHGTQNPCYLITPQTSRYAEVYAREERGRKNILLKSTDRGETWKTISEIDNPTGKMLVHPVDKKIMFYSSQHLYISKDEGKTWVPSTFPPDCGGEVLDMIIDNLGRILLICKANYGWIRNDPHLLSQYRGAHHGKYFDRFAKYTEGYQIRLRQDGSRVPVFFLTNSGRVYTLDRDGIDIGQSEGQFAWANLIRWKDLNLPVENFRYTGKSYFADVFYLAGDRGIYRFNILDKEVRARRIVPPPPTQYVFENPAHPEMIYAFGKDGLYFIETER